MPDLAQLMLNFGGEPDYPVTAEPGPPATPDDAPNTIGDDLCRARQRSGKTLTEISLALKIATHHLTAMEHNSFDALPGRAYAFGFLRSYASYLGLDASSFIGRLRAEMAVPDVTLPAAPPIAQLEATPVENGNGGIPGPAYSSVPERGTALFNSPDITLRQWVTAAIMGVVSIYFGYSMMTSSVPVAQTAVAPVPARLAAEAGLTPRKTGARAIESRGKPAPISSEPAPASANIAAPPAVASVPVQRAAEAGLLPRTADPPVILNPAQSAQLPRESAPRPSETITLPPVANAGPSSRTSREPGPNTSLDLAAVQGASAVVTTAPGFTESLPPGQPYGEFNRNSRVTLRVHRATHVAVLGIRNHEYIDRVLRAGDTYRVPNMAGLKLSVSDAGAVEVLVDGKTVGFAGSDGISARGLSLQPQSIIHRFRRTPD